MKRSFIFNSAVIAVLAMMVMVQAGVVSAQMQSNIPECQFTSEPTPDMMLKCQEAAKAASPQTVEMGPPSITIENPNFPLPEGFDSSKIDFSKFGSVPTEMPGGATPAFLGVPLAGGKSNPGIAKLGNALEEIKQGLTQAEEGIAEMKDGQIKIDSAMEQSVKAARPIYEEAVKLFQAGDYAGAGARLQELNAVGFDKKFATFAETQGVSLDLIKDIRAKITAGLAVAEKNAPADEIIGIKGDIIAQQKYLDEAEALLKAGKKKEASAILKKMRQEFGSGEAQASLMSGKAMPASKLATILDEVSAGIDRAGSGFEKAKSSGDTIPQDISDLHEKIKSLYAEAKKAFDSGDTATATEKVKEIRDLNPEQKFLAFRDTAYPKDRLQAILQEGKDGSKALGLSIDKAKEYGGVDIAELDKLSVELNGLIAKAEAALSTSDTDSFLSYMSQAKALGVRDKVDAVIRPVAMNKAKDILGLGIDAMRGAAANMASAIARLQDKKGNVTAGRELLATMNAKISEAQALHDAGEFMAGGRTLDDGVMALTRLLNILNDSGVAMTPDQTKAVNEVFDLSGKTDGLANIPAGQGSRLKGLITSGKSRGFETKNTLSALSPELIDKVIAYRSSDKQLIDGIINDIIPLVPEDDKTAILEGKIGLLDEAKSANKSISVMKGIKGVNANVLKTMQDTTNQVKSYTFTPDVAENLQKQMVEFNDKIQSGDLKDVKGIEAYVQVMKEQVNKGITTSSSEKFKNKVIPARNIDTNNPLFDEVKYLKDDGAVAPDKNGNINLEQKIDKKTLAGMVNKTADKNVLNTNVRGNATIQDVAKSVVSAYGVRPSVDLNNPAQATKYLGQIGADVGTSNYRKQATLKDVADILAAADQRWGSK